MNCELRIINYELTIFAPWKKKTKSSELEQL